MKNILPNTETLNMNVKKSFANKITFDSFSKIIIVFLVCLLSNNLYSQNYKEFETGFSTIFIDSVNSYNFGNNPAYLNFNLDDEFLSLKSQFHNDQGDFKKFITPGINRTTDFFASGKKSIDSTQKFKGSFGFSKIERKNWEWIFTRDY